MGNFKEDIARVRAFVLDVDGVMTDGGIIPTPDGDFVRRYHAQDGYAIAYAIRCGYKVCVISGGRGDMLRRRLEMLGVTRMYLNRQRRPYSCLRGVRAALYCRRLHMRRRKSASKPGAERVSTTLL